MSGWCPPGTHPVGHRICQQRIDAGLLDGCGCGEYGGHESVQNPSATRVSGDSTDVESETENGPQAVRKHRHSRGPRRLQGVD